MEDLRAVRERLVAAEAALRRTIERSLHDGVQQQLVALGVKLQLAEQLVGTDPARLSSAFEELRRDVHDALATVRQLAWEVYPALLLDRGLVPALRAVAADLEATAVGRHDRDVEAAVYFSCVAVLAQAPAARATVRLEEDADALACEIHLDGALLEPLAGVVDRIAAVGGATTFTPSSMRAVIPLPPGRG